MSDATYSNRETKYGGMESSDIKHLKESDDETRRLKSMFADFSFERSILKDIIDKSCKVSDQAGAC